MTPEQDQKSNRVRKALHTQLHSDPRVSMCIRFSCSNFVFELYQFREFYILKGTVVNYKLAFQ